ncbi:HD-GYP domain-containing protein [Bacillus sp. PS06]|uniref:HD-GYP domain-containing protein n=1 Tax=Bacillus sp. PS06 TaxID=2764176 RepID=UPI00296FB5A1|nr:HD domain-containing phosphohydrolase [Bacillus sp. PS06]
MKETPRERSSSASKVVRLNGVLDCILFHHERFDGKGYPTGRKEKEIPLVSRITAIADTFNAMTTQRVYRKSSDIQSALND